MLLAGENSRVVAPALARSMDEIRKTLPEGVEVDVFYDRTELVQRTVRTLRKNLLEGGVLVILVLLVLLGSLPGGLDRRAGGAAVDGRAFVGMWFAGLSGNLMSLGAIDFGLIVDGSCRAHRERCPPRRRAPASVQGEAGRRWMSFASPATRSPGPVVFGVGIILLVYLPILSLRGLEGKMFRPMALTVIFALLTSLVLALTADAGARVHLPSQRVASASRCWCAGRKPLTGRCCGWPSTSGHRARFGRRGLRAERGHRPRTSGAVFIPKLDEGSIAHSGHPAAERVAGNARSR